MMQVLNLIYIVFFYMIVFLNCVTGTRHGTVIKILKANEIVVEDADTDSYRSVSQPLSVHSLSGSLLYQYDDIVMDCTTSCDTHTILSNELEILKAYAAYVTSFESFADMSAVRFGLLKSTASANIYGQYVRYNTGQIEFYIRPSVIVDKNFETAYLLLLNVAAHERAHDDNYIANGEFGHGDYFQMHFNTIYWDALNDISKYRQFYASSPHSTHVVSDNHDSIDVGLIVLIIVCVIIVVGGVFYALMFCNFKKPRKEVEESLIPSDQIRGTEIEDKEQRLKF